MEYRIGPEIRLADSSDYLHAKGMVHTFGPSRSQTIGRVTVRINDDIKKAVVFLGHQTISKDGREEFVGVGTGFFLHHAGWSHLVTCRHVARSLGGTPFVIRTNSTAGGVCLVDVDRLEWFYHPDENIDVAVLPCGLQPPADWIVLSHKLVAHDDEVKEGKYGIGDLAYVVGLFRLLFGEKRNLPIVHSGNIAMVPMGERIPVVEPASKRVFYAEGYLVEAHSLDGLSGSPVFARRTWRMEAGVNAYMPGDIVLLGMWQGAWGGEPAPPIAARFSGPIKVPLGLGFVIPVSKIVETMALPEVEADREWKKQQVAARNALITEASSQRVTATPEPSTKVDNPSHKEDFNRLLDAAVKGRKSDD